MSYIFVNKPAVTFDIEDVVDYYKSINPELATAFLDRIDEAKKYIADFPNAFQIKYKNVRTVLLEQFPYHIHYIVDDAKKQIVVLAVIHAYRNPKDYSNR
ncbi:type II toxin-antitoxin system RelE/ParE family toxin [Flavobacterium psychrophilum]|uniref:type II toxin-antitoxin system RelE/ParE family toxin n=1 Tax=Flavobacterium psychrophilum TaxID=96345 RepID=UPI000B7C3515|nr:type II toxin-antitoxin system RelE/ParE family toxin [Flavobacterium psychrophilum]EKT3967318.1 type II toxin-antitoxin system RelE/ParE family toxin [Flavobacterium psychrophilum]MCB6231887.1 type II toxin-antitoxin system RelE/ParE family toxin [Flavobacterium psychrophilum]MCB6231895.1 type II toxin-antitoxin system RelE/ParE family toxin [Flavobacterium psychrophilum]MEB3380558.1 type II toxin-antitoxin system RelE/ParE family toxin [Flavobacterium psychrophilum]SNA66147.1 conserved hy